MHLQPKVIVQMTGSMFLNHEAPLAALPATSWCSRFRLCGFSEIAFCSIRLERVRRRRSLRVFTLEITLQFGRELLHLLEHWFEKVAKLFRPFDRLLRC